MFYSLTDGKLTKSSSGNITIISQEDFSNEPIPCLAASEWIDHDKPRQAGCKVEFEEEYLFGVISSPRINIKSHMERSFYFIFDKKNIIIVDLDGSGEKIMDGLTNQRHLFHSLSDVFLSFFERYIMTETSNLYEFEEKLEALESKVLESHKEKHAKDIFTYRKNIISIHNFCEQLITIAERFEYEEYFPNESSQLRGISDRLQRLDNKLESLRDYSSQIRESFQSQTDIKMNKTMQTLTVITVLFMPITVISAWYGMNFAHMPELSSPYSYIITIVLTLLLTVASILYCKRKKIL